MPWKKSDLGVVHFVSTFKGPWWVPVAQELSLSLERLAELSKLGSIYLNNQRIFQDCDLQEGDYLRLHTEPRRYPVRSLKSRIVFEDQDFLILDKPAGLPCHPTVDNALENLLVQLNQELGIEVLLTHRLDVPTSGLLVFAKNKVAQSQFHILLQNRKIQKLYEAEVDLPGPEIGFYEHHMVKTEYAPKVIVDLPTEQTQNCQMRILENVNLGDRSRLKIELLTGRTHQIRAQLAFLGFPILQDGLYHHFENSKPDEKIQLRCTELRFSWKSQDLVFKTCSS